MKPIQRKLLGGIAAFLTIVAVAELAAYAQAPKPTAAPAATKPTAAALAQSAAAASADREQIWNSPSMLRAALGSKSI